MSALSKFTFRMRIEKHDITADKHFFASTLTEAMHLVRQDILKVVDEVADKRRKNGDPDPTSHLTIHDFQVELLNEQPAQHKH